MTTPESLTWFRPTRIARERTPTANLVAASFGGAIARLRLWRSRYNGRRTIRSMTSEQIRDLDLDPVALKREAAKPFWRA